MTREYRSSRTATPVVENTLSGDGHQPSSSKQQRSDRNLRRDRSTPLGLPKSEKATLFSDDEVIIMYIGRVAAEQKAYLAALEAEVEAGLQSKQNALQMIWELAKGSCSRIESS